MPRRIILWFIIILFVVVAALAIRWVYRPSAVVAKSMQELGEATTADFVSVLQVENSAATQQLLKEEGAITLEVAGVWREEQGPDSLSTHVTFTTETNSVSVKVQGELRLIADKLYLRITTAPAAFPVLVQLKDQWIVMNRNASEQERQTILDAPRFVSVDREGTEKIGDTNTVHYITKADQEAVISFMDNLADIVGSNLSEQQMSQIRGSVGQVTRVPLEVWIKRWGNDVKQLKATIAVPGGNDLEFTVRFNQLNQPVEITTPEGARSFQEIIQAQNPTPAP